MLVRALHAFAGNLIPVIRARHLLEPQEWNSWSRHIGQTIEATALHDRLYANWPQSVGVPRPGRTALLVQHCHGAPGIVNCLADFPDSGIDDLLHGGGGTNVGSRTFAQRSKPMSRHGRQRLCVSQAVLESPGFALARSCTSVCYACDGSE